MSVVAGGIFGRDQERAVLAAAIDGAVDGCGSVIHIVGEPGIGKTALCDEAVAMARLAGVDAAWGRAVEGAPAFWPWRAVVPKWPGLDGGFDRFELFEAVLEELATRAAGGAGLLVVLDDLHWADEASLRLLAHVGPAVRDHRLVIVATARRHEVQADDTLGAVVATLARLGPVLELGGLDAVAVASMAATATGLALAGSSAEAIAGHTNGNPFFIDQVLRVARSRPGNIDIAQLAVPAGVDAVVRQRVRDLGDDATEVLTAASAVGRSFPLSALSVMLDGAIDPTKALDAAAAAGLVTVDPARADHLRFVHAIIRDALYGTISLDRRAALHERAYRYLITDGDVPPAVLATHAAAAARLIGTTPAVGHTLDAASAALQAQAFEDALRLVHAGLDLAPDSAIRGRLLLIAGTASFHLDDLAPSTRYFIEAANLAEARGDGVALAEAVLAVGTGRMVGPPFSAIAPKLPAALALLGESHPGLRADLLSRQADFVIDAGERRRLLAEAIELARSAGDDRALGVSLGRLVLHGVSWMTLAERLEMVDELRAVSRRVGSAHLHLDAEAVAVLVLLEAGDLDGALSTAVALAADPVARAGSFELRAATIIEVLVAVARGRLDWAEEKSSEIQGELQRRGKDSVSVLTAQMLVLALEQGRGAMVVQLLEALRTAPEYAPYLATIDITLAVAHARGGDLDAARAAIDTALRHDLETVACDWAGNGVASCGQLAEAMWLTGHTVAPARLAALLEPVADRNLVIGMLPAAVLGWATYPMGLCALLEARFEDARRLLADAADRHRAMGAVPLLGRNLLALAEAHAGCLDGTAALAAATEAAAILRDLPLTAFADRAAALVSALGGDASGSVSGPEARATLTFVFTDIVSSTAQTAARGDNAWIALLNAHTSVVRALAVRHGGRVVKGLGDGFLVTFPTAAAGVRFAVDANASTAGTGLSIRAGLHAGEAQLVDGDHYGHDVNLAARVASQAGSGEVLVSSVVASLLAPNREFALGPPRVVELKGIPGAQTLHPVTG